MTLAANPDHLQSFVDTSTHRSGLSPTVSSVAALQQSVAANSDYGGNVPALTSLAQWCNDSGIQNERWVSIIRSALLNADRSSNGSVTIDSAAVLAQLNAAGLSAPPPLPTVAPSSYFGLPPTSGFADDPVCLFNGNFVHQEVDLAFPALAALLTVERTYNSLSTASGAFGTGWASILDVRLRVPDHTGSVHVTLADGAVLACVRPGPNSPQPLGGRPRLMLHDVDEPDTHTPDTPTPDTHAPGAHGPVAYRLTDDLAGVSWAFDAHGQLRSVHAGPSAVHLERDGGDRRGRVTKLHDTITGRWVAVEWSQVDDQVDDQVVDRVVALRSSDGHAVTFEYRGGVLVGAHRPDGGCRYQHDDHGRIISIHDADGVRTVANRYDDTGRVAEQTSQFGRVTTYRYDATDGEAPGVTTTVTGDDGIAISMTHDPQGNLVAMIDGDGHAAYSAYDRAGRRTVHRDRLGQITYYRYDAAGRVQSRRDPDGLTSTWAHDDLGRLTEHVNRAGATLHFRYHAHQRVPSTITGPDGYRLTIESDELGNVVRTVDADGVELRSAFDRDGQLVHVDSAIGRLATLRYDDAGLVCGGTDAVGVDTTLATDSAGRVITVDRAGARSVRAYSAAGRPTSGSEPGDVEWSNTFGDHGALAATTDALGSTVGFHYDSRANVTAVVAPDGAVYGQQFDAVNRLTAVHLPTGGTTHRRYDAEGNLVEVVDPTGAVWARTLDSMSRTVSATDPEGRVTTWTYHPMGEVATVTQPDGAGWRHEIDRLGRTIAVTNPAGKRATMRYTPGGRLAERTSPSGRSELYSYDAAGRCIAITARGPGQPTPSGQHDAPGNRLDLTLDQIGRVTQWLGAGAYADAGRLRWGPHGPIGGARRTSAAAPDVLAPWSASYDTHGRLATLVDLGGGQRQFAYDRRGLPASIVDAAGLTTSFDRDPRGQVVAEHWPGTRQVTYGYDAAGQCVRVVDDAAGADSPGSTGVPAPTTGTPTTGTTTTGTAMTTVYERDAAGRLIGVVASDGRGWRDRLDGVGHIVERTDRDGHTVASYTYDDAGRLVLVSDPASTGTVSLLWDDDGLLARQLGGARPFTVERDADGWLVAIHVDDPSAAPADHHGSSSIVSSSLVDAIERDLAGRVAVDRAGRVIRYDVAGRIAEIVEPGTTGPDGQPTATTTTTTLDYGSHGLLVAEDRAGHHRQYAYDGAGRIVRLIADGVATRFQYDIAGRRSQDVREDGTVVTYHWGPTGLLDGWTEERPGSDARKVPIRRDALGAVMSIGADADTADDAWSDLGGVWTDRYGVFPARAYDAHARQWLSPDPLPTVPGTNGSASSYSYLWLDPINLVDPTGMRPLSDAEYQAWNDEQARPKWGDTLLAAAVIAGGVALVVFTGGAAAAVGAGILFGAGASAGIGLATGNFSTRSVAIGGIMGGLGAGAGAAFGATASALSISTNLAGRTAFAAVSEGALDAGYQWVTTGQVDPTSVAISAALGGGGNAAGEAFNAIRHARTTARLQAHVDAAVNDYETLVIQMSPAQRRRSVLTPGLEPAMYGSVIDDAAKARILADPKLSHLSVTERFKFGPDIYDSRPFANQWWDVTTENAWPAHVAKYTPDYGEGTFLSQGR